MANASEALFGEAGSYDSPQIGKHLSHVSLTLPALSNPGPGKRRVVVVAVLGGIEDSVRREVEIEYDAAGNVILPRPNAPGYTFASANGRTCIFR